MGTLVLDFDSTLIRVESLEEILRPRLASRPELVREMQEITDLGMSGAIGFGESLRRRLALAQPTLADVTAFASLGLELVTPGMDDVVAWAKSRGHDVRIVSGALRESALPVAALLGVAASHVHAVSARWGSDGSFLGLDAADPFARSKLDGVRTLSENWARPRVGVGDGATDLELFRGGVVDRFVAFTGVRRRESVLASGIPEARNALELLQILEDIL